MASVRLEDRWRRLGESGGVNCGLAGTGRGPWWLARLLLMVCLLVLLTTGCNRIFGTSLSGSWEGSFRSADGGTGILLLDLEVAGGDVSGTWESSFTGAIVNGTVSGLADELLTLKLTPAARPDCRYNVVAEQSRDVLTGTYSSACVLTGSGTFELEKR